MKKNILTALLTLSSISVFALDCEPGSNLVGKFTSVDVHECSMVLVNKGKNPLAEGSIICLNQYKSEDSKTMLVGLQTNISGLEKFSNKYYETNLLDYGADFKISSGDTKKHLSISMDDDEATIKVSTSRIELLRKKIFLNKINISSVMKCSTTSHDL